MSFLKRDPSIQTRWKFQDISPFCYQLRSIRTANNMKWQILNCFLKDKLKRNFCFTFSSKRSKSRYGFSIITPLECIQYYRAWSIFPCLDLNFVQTLTTLFVSLCCVHEACAICAIPVGILCTLTILRAATLTAGYWTLCYPSTDPGAVPAKVRR